MRKKQAAALALALALALPWAGLAAQNAWGGAALPADAPAAVEGGGYIALTFDDGPRRSTTTKLLDGLAERGVHATFFLVGEQVAGSEDIVKRMEAEGHQIGVHTYDHVRLTGLSAADFSAQVDRTRDQLREILGHDDFWLRPPYGMTDKGVVKRAGSPIILWSIDPEDWNDKNVDRIVDHVVSRAAGGDIILLHDIYPTSVDAALRIVDALHKKGFLFLTVEELCQAGRQAPKPGEICRQARP